MILCYVTLSYGNVMVIPVMLNCVMVTLCYSNITVISFMLCFSNPCYIVLREMNVTVIYFIIVISVKGCDVTAMFVTVIYVLSYC